jgi:hypothetical protein
MSLSAVTEAAVHSMVKVYHHLHPRSRKVDSCYAISMRLTVGEIYVVASSHYCLFAMLVVTMELMIYRILLLILPSGIRSC